MVWKQQPETRDPSSSFSTENRKNRTQQRKVCVSEEMVLRRWVGPGGGGGDPGSTFQSAPGFEGAAPAARHNSQLWGSDGIAVALHAIHSGVYHRNEKRSAEVRVKPAPLTPRRVAGGVQVALSSLYRCITGGR